MKKSNWLGVLLSVAAIAVFLFRMPADAQKNPSQVTVVNSSSNPVPVVSSPKKEPFAYVFPLGYSTSSYQVPASKILVIEYVNTHVVIPKIGMFMSSFSPMLKTYSNAVPVDWRWPVAVFDPNNPIDYFGSWMTSIYCDPGSLVVSPETKNIQDGFLAISGYLIDAN